MGVDITLKVMKDKKLKTLLQDIEQSQKAIEMYESLHDEEEAHCGELFDEFESYLRSEYKEIEIGDGSDFLLMLLEKMGRYRKANISNDFLYSYKKLSDTVDTN